MLEGLRTVVYHVDDLKAAKEWYAKVLGKAPYFDQPFYVGFNVGGYELGLVPVGELQKRKVVAYWSVADAKAEFARLKEMGAEVEEELTDVGAGILVATVRGPSGNPFGIIQNTHFKPE